MFLLERTGNSVVTLNSGNDWLRARGVNWLRARGVNDTTGSGNMTVSGGLGNDDILMNMNGRHSIDLGAGNDLLEINGNVDDFNTITANDGTTTIDAGTGNDSVQINGNGRYSVGLGDGGQRHGTDLGRQRHGQRHARPGQRLSADDRGRQPDRRRRGR